VALSERNAFVPYRNSMMTSILRDSLGGNCKTVMIATLSNDSEHVDVRDSFSFFFFFCFSVVCESLSLRVF
jgi:kinesin family protein 6/9